MQSRTPISEFGMNVWPRGGGWGETPSEMEGEEKQQRV